MAVSAAELSKLVSNAVEAGRLAEEGDAAEQGRAVDVLKVLQKQIVTAALLKDTDAGKKINKLSKSSNSTIAAAASQVVQAWKETIKQQQESKPSTSSGPLPASGSQGSLNRLQSNSSGSLAPEAARKSKPPPSSGNTKRDRIRTLLSEGLLMVPQADADADAGKVAADVESAVFNLYPNMGADYAAKVRSLSFNLKDPNNPDLRRNVLAGSISPQQLVAMTAEEMASKEVKEKNKEIREQAAWEVTRSNTAVGSTDQFQCGKCKQRKTTYYQLQTRSADEPMTTFVTCVNCNNRWKFC